MITSKLLLKETLNIEGEIYKGHRAFLRLTETDILWSYIKRLRLTEYYINTGHRYLGKLSKLLLHRMQCKYGIHIPVNTCDVGLSIAHIGPIIINSDARIGKNVRIHVGVNIGDNGGENVPRIGNNVYIGPGAKIFGKIEIADDVKIGANAVVNRSCNQKKALLVGVPAVEKFKLEEIK